MVLLILCGLIWCPILIYQIDRRGFLVLLVWLSIAPVAANVVARPGANPFFPRHDGGAELFTGEGEVSQQAISKGEKYYTRETTVTLTELFNPTRFLFVAFFIVLLFDAAFKHRLTPLDRVEKLMLVFSVIMLVGALRSIRVLNGIRLALDAIIVPFLGYYICRRLVTSEERLRKLAQVVCIVGGYIIVIAVLERLMHSGLYYRLGSIFGHHHALSLVVAMVFLIMLADAFRGIALPDGKGIFPNTVRYVVLCLAPVIVLLTWNRANWVGFLMSVSIFLFLSRRFTRLARKLALIGCMLIFLSVAVFGLQTSSLQDVAQERVTQRTGTVHARFGAWILTLKEAARAPIVGIGLNNLRGVLGTTHIEVMGKKSETSSHNTYLALFAELGAIGLLVYFALVISIIQMGLRLYRSGITSRDRWYGVMIIGIMVAYLLPALFANTLYAKALSQVYVYAFIGGIAGLYSQRLPAPKPYVFPGRYRRANSDVPAIVR